MEASFEHDPVFGKILRNIRLTIRSVRNFEEREVLGEKILTPVFCEANEHLSEIPDNESFAVVAESVRYSKNIPQVLAKLCKNICEQEEYSRAIPLMRLARNIRDAFVEAPSFEEQSTTIEHHVTEDETRNMINEMCSQLQREMHSKYVAKKKVAQKMYECYFHVIQYKLIERYVHLNGEAETYFEMMKEHIPELTSAVYRKKHRAVLEYLAALAHERATKRLKKNFL